MLVDACLWSRVVLVAFVLLAVGGCGGRKMCLIRGKVVYRDGAPLRGGMVILEPLDSGLDISARGQIQKDGAFRLGTHQETDGAPEGRYRVLIVPVLGMEGGGSMIDPKYERPETSPLEYTVSRDKDEALFEIDRPSAAGRRATR